MQSTDEKKRDLPRLFGSSGGGGLMVTASLQLLRLIPSTVAGFAVDPFIIIFAGCLGLFVLIGFNWRSIRQISGRYRFRQQYKFLTDLRNAFTKRSHKYQSLTSEQARQQYRDIDLNYVHTLKRILEKHKIFLPEPSLTQIDYRVWIDLIDELAGASYKGDLKTARERFSKPTE